MVCIDGCAACWFGLSDVSTTPIWADGPNIGQDDCGHDDECWILLVDTRWDIPWKFDLRSVLGNAVGALRHLLLVCVDFLIMAQGLKTKRRAWYCNAANG
jgi:hypothetical protein